MTHGVRSKMKWKKTVAWKRTAAKCSIRPEILWKLKASRKDFSHAQSTGRKTIKK